MTIGESGKNEYYYNIQKGESSGWQTKKKELIVVPLNFFTRMKEWGTREKKTNVQEQENN